MNGRLVVVGGARDGASLAEVVAYDPVADSWTALAPPMPTGRSGHAAAVLDGCLYALGGEGNARTSSPWRGR